MSCRVKTALKLKGIEHEFIEEDLANKSPLLVKYNPVHKKIHLPLHNGKPICESLVILECIDETWKGTPILPKDPREIAMARFWANFIDEKCFPAILKALSSKDDEQEKAMEEASEDLKTLEAQLNDKKNFPSVIHQTVIDFLVVSILVGIDAKIRCSGVKIFKMLQIS
ncbi:probable glutathione S-transferase [Camellia sinensis]|uniref:probable glutathione S-transferase n=1 Tax=Camellia sinensis TaxID=4442 RepID=UPI001035AD6E|nr:probable glutathione S-transferase [Camellia sinensis]